MKRILLAVAACSTFVMSTSFVSAQSPRTAGTPGTKENPIVASTKVLKVTEQQNQKTVWGNSCLVRTAELEISAPGIEPSNVIETLTFCDQSGVVARGKGRGLARPAYSPNVTQYAPPPSYTCIRGQGIGTSWNGTGTIETQYISYEENNNFYIAYGSGIGLTLNGSFNWTFGPWAGKRYYAATMRTSGSLSGTGSWCYW